MVENWNYAFPLTIVLSLFESTMQNNYFKVVSNNFETSMLYNCKLLHMREAQ
jgi:hypothetical protein